MDYINILKSLDINVISSTLAVSKNAINRWIAADKIPVQYNFEILKLANINIDYTMYPTKSKDQFFTPLSTASHCFQVATNVISKLCNIDDYIFIEPSAGDGSMLSVLPYNAISMDIEPRNQHIMKQDFLDYTPPPNQKYIVFGNPPFGLRGHLALKFINHSYAFADFVCFILPQLFESDGKGFASCTFSL